MPETTTSDDLPVAQVAAELGVKIRTIQVWIKSGKLAATRPDNVGATFPYLVPRAEVDRIRDSTTSP